MPTKTVQVEERILLNESKCPFIEGLMELISNSLDADAKNIYITIKKDPSGMVNWIDVKDDGIGMDYNKAELAFENFGDSIKRDEVYSKGGRKLIGKDGKGRFKAFSVGEEITFKSIYYDPIDKNFKSFSIFINKTYPKQIEFSNLIALKDNSNSGVTVELENITTKLKGRFNSKVVKNEISKSLVPYFSNDKNFKIYFNNELLNFEDQVKDRKIEIQEVEINGKSYPLEVEIIQWGIEDIRNFSRKVHYCTKDGYILKSKNLILRATKKLPKVPNIPFSVYLKADYIEDLNDKNELNIDLIYDTNAVLKRIDKLYRDYVYNNFLLPIFKKDKSHIIDKIKEDNLYPYPDKPPKNETERIQRKTFDFLVTKVDEVQKFSTLKKDEKRYILTLLKLSLESQTDLSKILIEVFKLPPEKVEEFSYLLNKTSLSKIIECSTEISKRLDIIEFIKKLTLESVSKSNFYGRKEIYKLISSATWIFGEEFNFGYNNENEDIEQKLNESIKLLSRDTLIEKIEINNFIERLLRLIQRTDRDTIVSEIQKKIFNKYDKGFSFIEYSNNNSYREYANNLLLILNDNKLKELLYKTFNVENNESLILKILENSKNKMFENYFKDYNFFLKQIENCNNEKEFLELKKIHSQINYLDELKNILFNIKKNSFESFDSKEKQNRNCFQIYNFFLKKIKKCKNEKEFLKLKKLYCNVGYLDTLKDILQNIEKNFFGPLKFLEYNKFYDFSEFIIQQILNDNDIVIKISEIMSYEDENELIYHIPNTCVARCFLKNNGSYNDNLIIEILKPKKEITEEVYGNFVSFANSFNRKSDNNKSQNTFILIGDKIDEKLLNRSNNQGKLIEKKEKSITISLTWDILLNEVSDRMELLDSKLSADISKEKEFDILNQIYSEYFTT